MASLFSKPNTIVYVRRSGLLVAGKQIKPARLNFPAGVITNLEVIKVNTFLKGCQAFFEDHQLKGKRVLMVLDQSLVFEKTLTITDAVSANELLDDFTAAIPYEPGKRARLHTVGGNELQIYAANFQFYDCLSQALHEAGVGKIVAITPAAAYGLSTDQKIGQAIEHFINDTTVRANANFATSRPL